MARIIKARKEVLDSMYHYWARGIGGGIGHKLKKLFGEIGLMRSILADNPDNAGKFMFFLEKCQPEIIVEIGTAKGISTLLLAHYAKHVHTFDILNYPEKIPLWHMFGVNEKITSYVCDGNEDKKKIIDALEFDFAFIDGNHRLDRVKFDFECVKKCGRVLFHDYYLSHNLELGPRKVVDSLPKEEVITNEPFAYWEGR